MILMANAAAQEAGVSAGQNVASALAVMPSLMLCERDTRDEAAALHEAALCALRFTPQVVLQPSGLLLEVAASLRLFGGLAALLEQLLAMFAALRLNVASALAPLPHAAWLLARAAQPGDGTVRTGKARMAARLDVLPLALLDTAVPWLEVLEGIGCRTLGDLRRLPRAGLARRFGPVLLDEMDRAYGSVPDLRTVLTVPENFSSKLELMARVENAPALLFASARLIAQLGGWLTARHAAVVLIRLVFHHEKNRHTGLEQTEMLLRLAEPSRDADHLTSLLRERLDRLELVAPVENLELIADEIISDATRAISPNAELFPSVQNEATTLNRLIEKLSARLGPQAVQRIVPAADHRPERSFMLCPADAATLAEKPGRADTNKLRGKAAASALRTALSPVWQMKKPEPLSLHGHKPVYGSSLQILAGPERIEAGWWDGGAVARDYFVAVNAAGQLLWIFRERLPQAGQTAWYLHGFFA